MNAFLVKPENSKNQVKKSINILLDSKNNNFDLNIKRLAFATLFQLFLANL